MSPPAENAEEGFSRFVNAELVDGLRQMGIVAPNSIQKDAVELALSGRDIMVVAQTGSGKTLAFLLPILQHMHSAPADGKEPLAVVMAPSLELARQVERVAVELAASLPAKPSVGCLTDGGDEALPRLVIATAQEAMRRWRAGRLDPRRLKFLSVDEADAVLCGKSDLVAEVDAFIREAEGAKEPPQLLLTMAHLTQVREDELLKRFPDVQHVRHNGVMVPTLRQCFHYFREDKDAKLIDVLGSAEEDAWLSRGTTLVFCGEAKRVEHVCHVLRERSPRCKPLALHLEMKAEERIASCRDFRESAKARVLVATDSAARGLDFPQLRHVVLYDVPSDVTAFVHCAGRTARRGNQGLVTCLVRTDQASLNQFDFKSHHGLRDAAPLQFQRAQDEVRPAQEEAPDSKPAKKPQENLQAEKAAQPGKNVRKERRRDPDDGRPYTFEELQRYYKRDFTKEQILSYWNTQCTPVAQKR